MIPAETPDSETGLQAVFLSNRPALLRFLRARGAGEAAEDHLQEIWVKISTTRTGPIAEPLSYLYRVANNLMLDRRRSEMRGAQRDLQWQMAGGGGTDVSEDPSGERVLIAREQLRQIEYELEALGGRVAEVFRRYRVEGDSQRRIALDLGVSLSAVEKDLQRAYRAVLDFRRRQNADL